MSNAISNMSAAVVNPATELRTLEIVTVVRRSERFTPQQTRVITRFFTPGAEDRIVPVINRVLALAEEVVEKELASVFKDFEHRHRKFSRSLGRHFGLVERYLPEGVSPLSEARKQLLGAYFTQEYSISAAALFNPSIVPHPDQVGIAEGALKFVMSFRATGEGHISSIEFRSGTIEPDGAIGFDEISPYLEIPEVIEEIFYEKPLFGRKLREMGVDNEGSQAILDWLGEHFTLAELRDAVAHVREEEHLAEAIKHDAIEAVLWLAQSNYTVRFPEVHGISERILFPVSETESRGIEDARFVRFVDDDGSVQYYATYTAYNGFRIVPQLIETNDFVTFKIVSLNGNAVHNKGMALFPRKINGKYMMLGRQDGENIYLMSSDNVHFWHDAALLQSPHYPWEAIQIGNNGSPIETERGWLMLTHGVGAMRKYCIGCTLLDLEDPSHVLSSLETPLLSPNVDEREGYVPNVVYSCGAILHNGELIIPYAMSDSVSGIATVNLQQLLGALT